MVISRARSVCVILYDRLIILCDTLGIWVGEMELMAGTTAWTERSLWDIDIAQFSAYLSSLPFLGHPYWDALLIEIIREILTKNATNFAVTFFGGAV